MQTHPTTPRFVVARTGESAVAYHVIQDGEAAIAQARETSRRGADGVGAMRPHKTSHVTRR